MTEQSPAEAIFFAALEKHTAEERIAYLNAACGDDSNLRQRVERLLAAHPKVGEFLESPTAAQIGAARDPGRGPGDNSPEWSSTSETMSHPGPSDGIGSVVAGKYKLLENLGQGGMGAVFMAQQTEPVKRLVALKLIKAGMDSRQILARFAAERQALALMDHPNIAKVLDAGATESGRPFFVMELVKGVPITRFCDERQLSPRERLELIIPVCHAIQHAHQKGVIHRDIKPTNVLVALYDDHPVPKVIDFGVAKAAGSQLTDASLVTGFGAIVGTPEYMSPEQAQLNQLDIDTRSDVYALGVLLYELLTGTTPFDRNRLGQGALLEVLRVIREEEPPRPSARLSSSETLASIAATRRTEPATLTKLVRGELDWIVMKCLEKERSRRYETANGLARDLERYLRDDVVEARPPSASYRLRKFVRKHRVGIGTASAFVVLLIAAAGISAVLAIKARRAEAEAKASSNQAKELAESLADSLEESRLTALSLQVDADLAELKPDQRIGLLKLTRTLKGINASEAAATHSAELDRQRRQLREFVTMAVLTNGQAYTTLLPPLSHGEHEIKRSFTSRSKPRVLTAGDDKSARLWDLADGRQIAILRRKDEKVLGAGLSPDGLTAFTDCSDGVVRLWETTDGTFRCETEARPERVKQLDVDHFDVFTPGYSDPERTRLSDNRVITFSKPWRLGAYEPYASEASRLKFPFELWDAKTGRLVGKLPPSTRFDFTTLVGNGRWIVINSEQSLSIYSAEDGRPVAELKSAGPWPTFHDISPSGHTMATSCRKQKFNRDALGHALDSDLYVQLWDTASWKPLSISGPFEEGWSRILLLRDDLFALLNFTGWDSDPLTRVFHPPSNSPVAVLREVITQVRPDGQLAKTASGQLFDTRHRRRVQPPKGRRHHPDLATFAQDGRFTVVNDEDGQHTFELADLAIDKRLEWFDFPREVSWIPGTGWSSIVFTGGRFGVGRLPTLDRLGIPPDLLKLWAQVAVRGQLDDYGTFAPWDESTWERKRQELAAKPTPYPDFPFPGFVAVDRLHWLRQEFENASDADKPRLARQLLERANAAGDRAEAVRWVAFIADDLVRSLFSKLLLRADVEEQLRRDPSLSSEIRAAALLRAARFDESASDLNSASWRIAIRSNAEKDEYRRALRWAEAAMTARGGSRLEKYTLLNALGVLQYRNGLYNEAIANLQRSIEAHRISDSGPHPSDLAFLAMAHNALGESDKARECLGQLTALCEQSRWKTNEEATGFLNEARQRLAAPP